MPSREGQVCGAWLPRPHFFYVCLFLFYFICFWLCWVFVAAHGLSLAAASRGSSLVAIQGLLIVVAPLVAEHRL